MNRDPYYTDNFGAEPGHPAMGAATHSTPPTVCDKKSWDKGNS